MTTQQISMDSVVVGRSARMRAVFEFLRVIGNSDSTVLVTGESGTGKEVVAKTIHQLSPRARAPLITVHAAGLPANLLESELFGHEKGAFTGAHERRLGRIEQAQGGSLFFDEIGEIDATVQVKLLRFLGERTFERVGSGKTISSDVRLIAATNKNLVALVQSGAFREDLFFRLKVVEIHLPPLRERKEDLPLLAQHFLRESGQENGKAVTAFAPEALELLVAYPWPGNVRELRTAIEHAVVFARDATVTARDLPPNIRVGRSSLPTPVSALPTSDLNVKEVEKELVIRALKECEGNRTAAARKLGISRRTMHRKLHEFGLEEF